MANNWPEPQNFRYAIAARFTTAQSLQVVDSEMDVHEQALVLYLVRIDMPNFVERAVIHSLRAYWTRIGEWRLGCFDTDFGSETCGGECHLFSFPTLHRVNQLR